MGGEHDVFLGDISLYNNWNDLTHSPNNFSAAMGL